MEDPASTQNVRRLKRGVRLVFGTLAVGFVAFAVHDIWSRWDGSSVRVKPGYFLLSIVMAGVAMWVQLRAFGALVTKMTGVSTGGARFARLYLDSQMARYTPGKLGLPVVRIAGADAVGISGRAMGCAILIELISWTATGSLVGGLALFLLPISSEVAHSPNWLEHLSMGSLLMAALAMSLLAALVQLDRTRYPVKIRGLFGDFEGPVAPALLPALHALHFLVWILTGACVAFSVGAGPSEALTAGALLCLAIVFGFIALLAPAGAGVREAVIAAGLAPLLGPSASLAVSLLARVASLVSDVALWGLYRFRAR